MAEVFCQNCGAQGVAGAPFCGNCGAKMPAAQPQQATPQQQHPPQPRQQQQPPQPRQQQWQQPSPPQQQWRQPPPQQQWQQPSPPQQQWQQPPQYPPSQVPLYGPGAQYAPQYPPPKGVPGQKSKKGLVTGLIIGGVVLAALVVVLIVVLGGGGDGGGGSILKDVRHSDLEGDYKGTMTIKNVKIDKGFENLADELGIDLEDIEEMRSQKGKEVKCVASLVRDNLTLSAPDDYFFGGDDLKLGEVEFIKGVAKGKKEESDAEFSTKVEYKITAHEGKKSDYRLYCVVTLEAKIDLDGSTGNFLMEVVFDIESK